jgi:hypothetical protein
VLLLQLRMSRSSNGEEGIVRADSKGYHPSHYVNQDLATIWLDK